MTLTMSILLQAPEVVEPWFDPTRFGALFGALAGGVGGSLAGLLGAAAGYLAPRGRGRRMVLGGVGLLFLFGLSCLGFGIVALLSDQPYGIWFGPILAGSILSGVLGAILPAIRGAYQKAEMRRIQAENLRAG